MEGVCGTASKKIKKNIDFNGVNMVYYVISVQETRG